MRPGVLPKWPNRLFYPQLRFVATVRRVIAKGSGRPQGIPKATAEQWAPHETTSRVPVERTPGMINLLSLEPVAASELPGIEFDLATRQLDVRPDLDFFKTFRFQPPWLPYRQIHPTLCSERDRLWERNPGLKLEKAPKVRQRTIRELQGHHTCCLRSELFEFAAGDKWALVHGSLAPRIPGGTFALNRPGPYRHQYKSLSIKPADATVTAEFRGDLVVPLTEVPSASLFWIDFNVDYQLLARSYNYMHLDDGGKPDPEADLLSIILNEFANSLEAYAMEKPINKSTISRYRRFLQLHITVMNGTPVPVILAIRGVFLFFIWEGGFQGRLVFQYGGNLLPGRHLQSEIA